MKKFLTLLMLAAAVPLAAENLDMVTIVPEAVASFVRMDVKDTAEMSKVTLRGSAAVSADSVPEPIRQIFARDLVVYNLTAGLQSEDNRASLPFAAIQFGNRPFDIHSIVPPNNTLMIVEGDITDTPGGGVIGIGPGNLFINGIQFDYSDTPEDLGWYNNIPVTGGGDTSVVVLCTEPR